MYGIPKIKHCAVCDGKLESNSSSNVTLLCAHKAHSYCVSKINQKSSEFCTICDPKRINDLRKTTIEAEDKLYTLMSAQLNLNFQEPQNERARASAIHRNLQHIQSQNVSP